MEHRNEEQELLSMLKPTISEDGHFAPDMSHEELVRIHELRFSLTSERVEQLVRDFYISEPEETVDQFITLIFEDV